MSASRQRFWTILSKWPIKLPEKEYDYGWRLRELVKNKNEFEEIFPGNHEENSRKLDALIRLINNTAKDKFHVTAALGACGFKKEEIRNLIVQQLKFQKDATK